MVTPNIQTIMDHTRLLAGVPVFAGVPREALMGIVKSAHEDRFAPGKIIIEEGEVGTRLFVIVSGGAEVSSKSSSGSIVLASIHRGDVFGEIAVVVPNTPRTATVKATEPLTVISFSAEDLNRLCGENPQVRSALESVAKRILLFNFIRRSSPFSSLPATKATVLIDRIKPLAIAEKTLIVGQGERGNFCYLLKSGSVDVVLKSEGGEKIISTLYPGALFGEASLLTNAVRNSSVVSREKCEILAISRQDLFDAVVSDQEIAARMMELLQLRDRPRHKAGIVEQVARQDERGQTVILKDPERGAYYRLTVEGKVLWDMLDGRHSLRDLTLTYFERFKTFSPQAIAEVVGGLGKAGFLESATWSESVQKLLVRIPLFARFVTRVHKTLEYVIMCRHVDAWFSRWYQNGVKWLFTIPARILWGGVGIAGVAGFVWLTPHVIPQLQGYAIWQLVAWVLLPLLISFLLHELGHGFAVKYFNREVMGVGVGWYWVTPIAFVDTSDMWLSERWPRIVVSLAGVAVNGVLVGIALIPASILGPDSYYTVYAWVFAAVSYALMVINLIPIRGTDGHYALSDFLH